MKLIRCYIENFGRLSQFKYEFKDGLNTIEEENGWGKTTFAAFIKAMFFGLEYKRGNCITDRKRYMPWNGKQFGGNLIFEIEGKPYKIERFFGKRDKDDTFVLYDLTRNTQSQDFTEKIGEEIWKVDRDSFEKTAFITLNDMDFVNDIISSKLGNIDEQEADMERSTMALEILEKRSLEIKPKRGKSGFLGKKEAEQKELKSELKTCRDSLHEIELKEEWIRQKQDELENISKNMKEIDNEQSKFALYEKKRHYDFMIQECQNAGEELEKVESFFKGKVLSKEDMNQLEETADAYINEKKYASEKQLTQEQKRELKVLSLQFENGVPGVNEWKACSRNLSELSSERIKQTAYTVPREIRSRFQALSKKFEKVSAEPAGIDGMLKNYQQVVELDAKGRDLKADMDRLERDASNIKGTVTQNKSFPILLIGICLLIFGIFLFLVNGITGGAVSIVGCILLISGLFARKTNKETNSNLDAVNTEKELYADKLADVKRRREQLASSYRTFLQQIGEKVENEPLVLSNLRTECLEYHRLKKELEEKEYIFRLSEKRVFELESALVNFFKRYSQVYSVNDYETAFEQLRKKVSQFEELKELEMENQKVQKSMKEKERYLAPVFHIYYDAFPESVKSAVLMIREQLTKLEEKKEVFKKALDRKAEFEKTNSCEGLNSINLPVITEEELKYEKQVLRDQKDRLINEISNYQKDITGLSLKADKIEDIESMILKNNQEIAELQKQWKLLDTTKQCLVEAKNELAAKYMKEMSSAFDKYMNKMDPKRNAKYQIDIKLQVMLEKDGQLHESTGLSKGMKDLVQVCMRMALVEAVYKDVYKPVLVLDDPFVNLDSERLDHAASLLSTIGEEYQIIYFICHNSRRATG